MEYWQSILERAIATIPVYAQYFSTLKLGTVGLPQFTAMADALPGIAQIRDNRVQLVDNSRQVGDFSWTELRLISLKVPKIIEGVLDPKSGLLDDLTKVYAIVPWSPEKTTARCGLLAPVWEAANAYQLSQVPPLPPIVRKGVDHGTFMSKLANYFHLSKAEKTADHNLDEARRDLREAARLLEVYCSPPRSASATQGHPKSKP